MAGSSNDKILKYDPATGNFLGTFAGLSGNGHVGPIDLAFGPDGNLYVTGFDNDVIVKINGTTGAILATKQGPAGLGFGPAAFGPGGAFYVTALDLNTFAGNVYRYDPLSDALTLFIPEGSGGLQLPGGLAFGPDGSLLLSNLVFDINFTETRSTILKYSGATGAFTGELVARGNSSFLHHDECRGSARTQHDAISWSRSPGSVACPLVAARPARNAGAPTVSARFYPRSSVFIGGHFKASPKPVELPPPRPAPA